MLARTRTPAKNSKTTSAREMIQRSVCFVAEPGQFQVKSMLEPLPGGCADSATGV